MIIDRTNLRIFSSIALLILTLTAKPQFFYVINDNDGFVNVRKAPSVNGQVFCQLNNGVLARAIGEQDTAYKNWMHVAFYVAKKDAGLIKHKPESKEDYLSSKVMNDHLLFTGYVYKDRLVDIEKQQELKPDDASNDFFMLYNDSIRIKLNDAAFDKQKHKIGIKDGFVDKVDGKYFVGTDGTIPKYEFKTFSVEIDRQKVNIPRTSYYDLYEPNLNRFTTGYVHNATLYIIMHNSDGAGSYEVIFIFKDNKYLGRYVFDGEC